MPDVYVSGNITAAIGAVANRFVTDTDMKVGAYTVANSGTMPSAGARLITVTTAADGAADTMGTVAIVGTNLAGAAISENITPVTDATATGTAWFRTVTSVTGAGWVIGEGNDNITVGVSARCILSEGNTLLHAIVVNATAAGIVSVKDSTGTLASLKASIAEHTYVYDIFCKDYLEVTAAANSDVTFVYRRI